MTALEFFVAGIPAPQGSKRAVGRTKSGRVLLVESSKKVKPWREAVAAAAREYWRRPPMIGPVRMEIEFQLPRPKALRQRMPRAEDAAKYPDLSKLLRSTEDALTGIIYADDSQIIEWEARKSIVEYGDKPGAHIYVGSLLWPEQEL